MFSIILSFSYQWCWTRQMCLTGWLRRLPLAELQRPSPKLWNCNTSEWTVGAEARGWVCESTLRGVWQSTIAGDRRCPRLLSKRGNNNEKPDIQPTRTGATESNTLEFRQKYWDNDKPDSKEWTSGSRFKMDLPLHVLWCRYVCIQDEQTSKMYYISALPASHRLSELYCWNLYSSPPHWHCTYIYLTPTPQWQRPIHK